MKPIRFVVVLIAAMAAVGFGSATAFASNGAGTPFKATYPTGPATTWTCSGAHVVNKATSPGSKDSETCIASGDLTGYVAGTFTSDRNLGTVTEPGCIGAAALGYQPAAAGITGWESDYFFNLGQCVLASAWTMTLIDNDNGTFTLDILASYPI